MDILILLGSLALILFSAHLFTNGVEWLGARLNLSQGAVGSVLAAVGTALPESIIPVVAVLFRGGEEGAEIGIGAILGAPFMLGTLAFLISGLAVFYYAWRGRRPLWIQVDRTVISRDLRFFLTIYTLALLAALLPVREAKSLVAVFLVGSYGLYLYFTLRRDGDRGAYEDLAPLLLARGHHRPPLGLILAQVIGTVSLIILGAHFFVQGIASLAGKLGIAPFLLSLIIAPIATELPEKFNSVVWLGKNKDTLALGNITGAMVFQSSIIPAVGILLTPWTLNGIEALTGLLALLSAGIVYCVLRGQERLKPQFLLPGGLFYLFYLFIVL